MILHINNCNGLDNYFLQLKTTSHYPWGQSFTGMARLLGRMGDVFLGKAGKPAAWARSCNLRFTVHYASSLRHGHDSTGLYLFNVNTFRSLFVFIENDYTHDN